MIAADRGESIAAMEGFEGKDRRESQRVKNSFVVRMRFPRLEDFRYRYIRDISRGGVFIQTASPKPVGSPVVLVLDPGFGAESVTLNGEVVTAIDAQEAAARSLQAGMGIRFINLDQEKRRAIEKILTGGFETPQAPPEPPSASVAAQGPVEGIPGASGASERLPAHLPTVSLSRPASPPPCPGLSAAPAPDASTEVARVAADARTFLASVESKDFYQILGVERDASSGEIRRAFLKLTRRFHPDNFFRRVPPEVTRDLEDVYDYATRAYETLMNRDHRVAYDISIGYLGGNREGMTAEEMNRLAADQRRRQTAPGQVKRAEQLYHQALTQVAAGQTAKAIANLKLALAFDPENAQIQAKLSELKKP
jgi:uncharacterized protein (TIGR02266 family)